MTKGYKTSEFYMILVPTIVSMLVLTGVIPMEGQSDFAELLKESVSGIVAIVAIVSYILSRTELKKVEMTKKPEVLG
jgi:hypothetical protein